MTPISFAEITGGGTRHGVQEKLVEYILDLLALNWLGVVVLGADFSAKTHVFYPDQILIQGQLTAVPVNAFIPEMVSS